MKSKPRFWLNNYLGRILRGLPFILLLLAVYRCDTLFDFEPPTIKIIQPEEGVSYYSSLPCSLSVTDNRKVEQVEVFMDGQSMHIFTKKPFSTDLDILDFEQSKITFKAVSHDKAGNFSEAVREINHTFGFKITSPNGGENWPEQSTQTITWQKSGDLGDYVSLFYSQEGGANWNEIVASAPNSGSYAWTLPNLTETQTTCRVKVSSGSYSDASAADFTITAEPNTLTLTSPNGGENWPELSGQNITWDMTGDVGVAVSLSYSIDRGQTWHNILESTQNDGSEPWILPNVFDDQIGCRVRVSSNDGGFADVSDADFTITDEDSIILISPNGGEIWREQTTQIINWSSTADAGENVSLLYSLDAGNIWSEITLSAPNTNSYSWLVPEVSEAETACRIKIVGDSIYSDISDGNFSIYSNPDLVGQYIHNGFTKYVDVSGDYAYVSAGFNGILIIDISNPSLPTLASTYQIPNEYAEEVAINGNHLYVAYGNSGLQIIDISNPLSPVLVSTYSTHNYADNIFISGTYAYLLLGNYGLQIINISNPGDPFLVGELQMSAIVNRVFVTGNHAYIAESANQGLQIIDVTNPTNPKIIGSHNTGGYAFAVFAKGSYAYVGDYWGDLIIIDISNPISTQVLAFYDVPVGAWDLFVTDKYIYIAALTAGIQVLSNSEPPTLVASSNAGNAKDILVSGSHAYIIGDKSLMIFNVSGLP